MVTEEFTNLQNYKSSAILKDGATLNIRAIRPGDEDKIISLFTRLSKRTVMLRFHYQMTEMSREEARQLCNVDYDNTFALAATTGEDVNEKFVAVVGHEHDRRQFPGARQEIEQEIGMHAMGQGEFGRMRDGRAVGDWIAERNADFQDIGGGARPGEERRERRGIGESSRQEGDEEPRAAPPQCLDISPAQERRQPHAALRRAA